MATPRSIRRWRYRAAATTISPTNRRERILENRKRRFLPALFCWLLRRRRIGGWFGILLSLRFARPGLWRPGLCRLARVAVRLGRHRARRRLLGAFGRHQGGDMRQRI